MHTHINIPEVVQLVSIILLAILLCWELSPGTCECNKNVLPLSYTFAQFLRFCVLANNEFNCFKVAVSTFLSHCGSKIESTPLYNSTISRTVIGNIERELWVKVPDTKPKSMHSIPGTHERKNWQPPVAHMPIQIHTCTHMCIWNTHFSGFIKSSHGILCYKCLVYLFLYWVVTANGYTERLAFPNFNPGDKPTRLPHKKMGFELVVACFHSGCVEDYRSN